MEVSQRFLLSRLLYMLLASAGCCQKDTQLCKWGFVDVISKKNKQVYYFNDTDYINKIRIGQSNCTKITDALIQPFKWLCLKDIFKVGLMRGNASRTVLKRCISVFWCNLQRRIYLKVFCTCDYSDVMSLEPLLTCMFFSDFWGKKLQFNCFLLNFRGVFL